LNSDASPFDGRALLLDWDGAVAVSNRLHAGAVSFLQRHAERIAVVSNNSTDLPEDFSLALARRGVRIPPSRIVLAGVEAIRVAASYGPKRPMVLGCRKMMTHALKAGLSLTRTDPDAIVLLRDTQINYRRLERAANGLRSGASLIVANPDATHPAGDGNVTPETGALLAALLACAQGVPVKKEIIGKPSPHLYWRALNSLNARIEDAVMIGDNPDTDIAGAQALGMEAVLVDAERGIGALA
jgi:4-nitrophenyl phosphatase